MLTLKEASKIALEKKPGDSIITGFEYGKLCIFHMLVKGADLESSLNYYVSVDRDTGDYDFFDIWSVEESKIEEFGSAMQKRLVPEQF